MDIFNRICEILSIIFLVYSLSYATFLLIYTVVGWIALKRIKQKRTYRNSIQNESYLPISVIVPAYNEGLTIVGSVKSLLALDYSLYEIVVVDDGSKDDTAEKVINAFRMHPIFRPVAYRIKTRGKALSLYESHVNGIRITLVRKENGGSKADANNMGINVSNYPYVLCLDADSVLQRDSLKEVAFPVLNDQNCVAVGGSVRILNDVVVRDGVVQEYNIPRNFLASLQVLEYERTFCGARMFYNAIRGNPNISGAFGLFEKETLIACGGYDPKSFGEDMDLVLAISRYCIDHHKKFKIDYSPNAVCWTQCPETFADLKSQRVRWHQGMRQNLKKQWRMIGNPKYGSLGLVTLPSFILYELLSPFTEIIGIITLVYTLAIRQMPFEPVVSVMGIYILIGLFTSLITYFNAVANFGNKLTFKMVMKILATSFFEIFFMHFYLLGVRLIGAFKSTKKMKWKPIQRKEIK